jgi:hypothetical protein
VRLAAGAFFAAACAATPAAAQDIAPPAEDRPDDGRATDGEGGAHGPQRHDQVKLSAQAGGSWATGNTKSFIFNGALRSALRLGPHQVTASGVFAYATAREVPEGAPDGAPSARVVADDNVYGRLRYDFFFGPQNGAFAGLLGFRDPSSGFLYRWMPYGGYLHVFASAPGRFELWGEAGYRVAWERLARDPQAVADGLRRWRTVHGPTAFVGAQVSLSDTVDLDAGAEALGNVRRARDVRVNTFASLLSKIAGDLSFGASFNSRYLTEPVGARAPLDTSLQVVFVHQHSFPLGRGG